MNTHPPASPAVRDTDRATPLVATRMPVTLVLDRLRSAFNVGNVLRLAEATRAEGVVACGYTASPPHDKLARTARGCDALVPCRPAATAAEAIRDLRRAGYTVYGVETAEAARPVWDVEFAFPAAVVLGNEALGVSRDALALCDHVVDLPCFGLKNSVNVGNCAAVVLYAALRQWLARNPDWAALAGRRDSADADPTAATPPPEA